MVKDHCIGCGRHFTRWWVFAAENENHYSSSSYARADNPGMHDARRLGAEYSGMPPSHSKRVFKLSQATLRMVDQSGWSKAQKVQCSFVRSGLHRCCSHWSHPTDDAHPNTIKYHKEPALIFSLSHSLLLSLSLPISFPHLPSVSLSLTNSLALIEPKQDEMLFWLHLIVLPRSLQAEPDRGMAGMGEQHHGKTNECCVLCLGNWVLKKIGSEYGVGHLEEGQGTQSDIQ